MLESIAMTVSPDIMTYLVIPILIMIARIFDVSLGTIRIIMISRSNRLVASFLGFFEVIIWLVAVTQVLQNLQNVVSYIAYGAGFAIGNYIGISIENKLAIGMQTIQIITKDNFKTLSMLLREEGFGVTNLQANGQKGQLDFIHVVTSRKRTKDVLSIVKQFDPMAFISITDLRSSYAGFNGNKTRNSWWPRGIVKKK
ncbi:MAG: DUF2179 domain-containing protein [Calditrichaceae bacterium]